jgi:hypothetical protein
MDDRGQGIELYALIEKTTGEVGNVTVRVSRT